jgi:hypothetical protein
MALMLGMQFTVDLAARRRLVLRVVIRVIVRVDVPAVAACRGRQLRCGWGTGWRRRDRRSRHHAGP